MAEKGISLNPGRRRVCRSKKGPAWSGNRRERENRSRKTSNTVSRSSERSLEKTFKILLGGKGV